MKFKVVTRSSSIPASGSNTVYLRTDNWNDYSFVTMFYMSVHDAEGELHDIGNVKLGYVGQTTRDVSHTKLTDTFEKVPADFFSLGTDADYYSNMRGLPSELASEILQAMNDVAYRPEIYEIAKGEEVFSTSLLRGVSISAIKGQFARIINGQPPLTDFKFEFVRNAESRHASVNLAFNVEAGSLPSTNIHAIIGRNGVGKTTLLNEMIDAVICRKDPSVTFNGFNGWSKQPISGEYFSSLVSVSFSAFDPFYPPEEQSDPTLGTCYFYIGLKNSDADNSSLRSIEDIHKDFIRSLGLCLSQESKKARWLGAISSLESDENFSEMRLGKVATLKRNAALDKALELVRLMSTGHAVVLLTITKLVARVEEKTLVIIDEPESHLHPPLLSAFIRALSELLHDRNGVAIIATHSPVVLQEVPKSCVWKIHRYRSALSCKRPEQETFGENVGILTREVFGLEVMKSGFHRLITDSVDNGGSYDEILEGYDGQLGFEAKAILKALVAHRDRDFVK